MKDVIKVNVNKDHSFQCDTRYLARTGENEVECLEITLVDSLCECWAYLDFKTPSGETYKTPRLDIVDGKINYAIPLSVLDTEGELKVQVVLQKESGEIWKSDKKTFIVGKSIDAVDDIPNKEDFISQAQKILDETVRVVSEFEEELSHKVDEEWVKQYVDEQIVNGEW